ncbi:hypothetical protein RQP46_009155 [Phenoliferia psychrophenolica]
MADRRVEYTSQDDDLIAEYLVDRPQSSWNSVGTYKKLAENHPHHSQQSWHDHYRRAHTERIQNKIVKIQRERKREDEKRIAAAAATAAAATFDPPAPADESEGDEEEEEAEQKPVIPRQSTSAQPSRGASSHRASSSRPPTAAPGPAPNAAATKRKREASSSEPESDFDQMSAPEKPKARVRVDYTDDDRLILAKYLLKHDESSWTSRTTYKDLADEHPHHSQESWHEHFRKAGRDDTLRKMKKLRRDAEKRKEAKRNKQANDAGPSGAAKEKDAAPQRSKSATTGPTAASSSAKPNVDAAKPAKRRKVDPPPPPPSDSEPSSDDSDDDDDQPPHKMKRQKFTPEDKKALVKGLVVYKKSYDPETEKYKISMPTVYERLQARPEADIAKTGKTTIGVHPASSWQSFHRDNRKEIDARVDNLLNRSTVPDAARPPASASRKKRNRDLVSDSDRSAVPVPVPAPAPVAKPKRRASDAPASGKAVPVSSAQKKSKKEKNPEKVPDPPRKDVAAFFEEDDALLVRFAAAAVLKGGIGLIWKPLGQQYPRHSASEWEARWNADTPGNFARLGAFVDKESKSKGKGRAVEPVDLEFHSDWEDQAEDGMEEDGLEEDQLEGGDEEEEEEAVEEKELDGGEGEDEVDQLEDSFAPDSRSQDVILAPATSSLPEAAAGADPSPPTPKPTPPHSRSQDAVPTPAAKPSPAAPTSRSKPSSSAVPSHTRHTSLTSLPSPFLKAPPRPSRADSTETSMLEADDRQMEAQLAAAEQLEVERLDAAIADNLDLKPLEGGGDDSDASGERYEWEDNVPQGVGLQYLLDQERILADSKKAYAKQAREDQERQLQLEKDEAEANAQRQRDELAEQSARKGKGKGKEREVQAAAPVKNVALVEEPKKVDAATEEKRRKRLEKAKADEAARAAKTARPTTTQANSHAYPPLTEAQKAEAVPLPLGKRPRASHVGVVAAAAPAQSPSSARQAVPRPSDLPSHSKPGTSAAIPTATRPEPTASNTAPPPEKTLADEFTDLAARYPIKRKQLKDLFYVTSCPKNRSLFEDAVKWYTLARRDPTFAGRDELRRRVERLVWAFEDDRALLKGNKRDLDELERTKDEPPRKRRAHLKTFQVETVPQLEAAPRRWPFLP